VLWSTSVGLDLLLEIVLLDTFSVTTSGFRR